MAELPLTHPPGETVGYRPISGLALAGFALSCLFIGVVLVSTLVALVQGLPVFLPSVVLWLAAAAAGVSFLAQMRIRNAEGTMAGMALSRAGAFGSACWWVSRISSTSGSPVWRLPSRLMTSSW